MLRSGPFGWLPAHEPVAVRCGYHNLTHSVVGIFGRGADGPTRSKFSMQSVNIINLQIAEPVMRTKRARVHVGRALAQHNPNAVPLGQSPIGCILQIDTKPKKVTKINTERSYRCQGQRARMPTGPFLIASGAPPRRSTVQGIVSVFSCAIK
jgi:hypothetical protein